MAWLEAQSLQECLACHLFLQQRSSAPAQEHFAEKAPMIGNPCIIVPILCYSSTQQEMRGASVKQYINLTPKLNVCDGAEADTASKICSHLYEMPFFQLIKDFKPLCSVPQKNYKKLCL